jgi:hypothetical protein
LPSTTAPSPSDQVFLGVYDFRYSPYALGDALTWQMNVLVSALEAGAGAVDHLLMVDPSRPACGMQPHIGPENYRVFLQNIFPAFLCNPLLRGFRLFRDRTTFDCFLASHLRRGAKMYPDWGNHLRRRIREVDIPGTSAWEGFPLTHSLPNAFHKKHGYLPRLVGPRGYELTAKTFLERHAHGKVVAAVHMRQSRLSSAPASLYRDSSTVEWERFLKSAGK